MAADKDTLSKAEYLSLVRMVGSEYAAIITQMKMGYSDSARLLMAKVLMPEGYEVAQVIENAVRH